MSDSTDSEQESKRTRRSSAGSNDPVCPVPHDGGKELLNSIIPTDVDTLFDMLFTDSEFLRKLRAERNTTGFVQSSWEQKPGGTEKTRKVTFAVTLNNVVGPRQAIVTESQVLSPISQRGKIYVVEHEVTNAKIPHADSFYVTAHICLTSVSSNETKLCVVTEVKYRKSVLGFIKGMIESNTWSGLRDYYAHLDRLLQEECRRHGLRAQSVSGIPALAGSRRRNGRPRRPAPGIPTHTTPAIQTTADISDDTANGILVRAVTFLSSCPTERSLIWTVFVPLVIVLLVFNAHLYVRMSNIEASRIVLNDQSSFNSPRLTPTMPPPQPVTNPPKYEECLMLLENEKVHGRGNDAKNRWKKILSCTVQLLNQAKEDLDSEIAVHISKVEDQNDEDANTKMAIPSTEHGGKRIT